MLNKGILAFLTALLSLLSNPFMTARADEGEIGNLTLVAQAASGPFAAFNIMFLSQLTLPEIGGGGTNVRGADIWGWTDATTGREYALVARTDGTAFVDVTDPVNPVYLGDLPTATGNKVWRDVKVYADHAFITSDSNGAHGMQVFDLTQLRNVPVPPVTFTETAHYSGFTTSHNVVINETSGFAYSVGGNTDAGGLHFVDISNPANPVAAGGYSGDGYTHDAQVVIYQGPDIFYQGREIAFCSNTDSLTLVDVTDKANPSLIAKGFYTASAYIHQGWLTEDQKYFLSDDELDERNDPDVNFTRTHIWDVTDLDNPIHIGYYEAQVQSIDHNIYTLGNYAYAANYTSGLRILDTSDIANVNLTEVAWIDTHPAIDSLTSFNGAWSVYPYFDSGTLIIGDRDEGLVVVRLLTADLSVSGSDDTDPVVQGNAFNYSLTVTNQGPDDTTATVLTAVLAAETSLVAAAPAQGSCIETGGIVTCTLGTINNGGTVAVDLTVSADLAGTPVASISVSADEIELNGGDNSVSIDTTILPDSDGDGLDDAFENSIGTDPNLSDTDNDGASDYDEVNFDGDPGAYTPGQDTDPLNNDSDSDGLLDGMDPLPLDFHFLDGDLAPLGAPDGAINTADLLIVERITLGEIQATTLDLTHGDLYPPGAPDGLIDVRDALLIHQLLLTP